MAIKSIVLESISMAKIINDRAINLFNATPLPSELIIDFKILNDKYWLFCVIKTIAKIKKNLPGKNTKRQYSMPFRANA